MAPDIDTLFNYTTDGYVQTRESSDKGYQVPDIILGGPTTRKIKVLSIGAGVTGNVPLF